MSRLFKLRKNEKGQTLVEFALVLPVLLLLVLGLIQFGIIFSAQIAITNAAREGVRVAAVGAKKDEIVIRINNSIGGHIFLPTLTDGNIDITPDDPIVGDEIIVEIKDVMLELFVPVPDVFAANDEIPLKAKASMRVEKISK